MEILNHVRSRLFNTTWRAGVSQNVEMLFTEIVVGENPYEIVKQFIIM